MTLEAGSLRSRSRGRPAGVLRSISAVSIAAVWFGAALLVAGCDEQGAATSSPQSVAQMAGDQASPPATTPPPEGNDPSAAPPEGDQDPNAEPVAPPQFTAEQLEQLVAPVALYPDPLLMDVLMAATYPAEVAEAAAWKKQNPTLNGQALDDAIADKGWDVSVNALTHATQAIELMAADPQWTRDLGEAFLAQQDDVLNAVQVMRNRACDVGNLKTNEKQQVIIEPAPEQWAEPAGQYVVPPPQQMVRILPAQPDVLYVPTYNPMVIYGAPPPRLYYPGVMRYPVNYVGIEPVISFGIGLAIGSLFWGDLDWHHHRVYSHRHRGYYGYGYRGGDWNDRTRVDVWRHEPRHRRGVSYRRPELHRRYSGGGDWDRRDDWDDRDRRGDYGRDGDRDRRGDWDRDGDRRGDYDGDRRGDRDSDLRRGDATRDDRDRRPGATRDDRDRRPGGDAMRDPRGDRRQGDARGDVRPAPKSQQKPSVQKDRPSPPKPSIQRDRPSPQKPSVQRDRPSPQKPSVQRDRPQQKRPPTQQRVSPRGPSDRPSRSQDVRPGGGGGGGGRPSSSIRSQRPSSPSVSKGSRGGSSSYSRSSDGRGGKPSGSRSGGGSQRSTGKQSGNQGGGRDGGGGGKGDRGGR